MVPVEEEEEVVSYFSFSIFKNVDRYLLFAFRTMLDFYFAMQGDKTSYLRCSPKFNPSSNRLCSLLQLDVGSTIKFKYNNNAESYAKQGLKSWVKVVVRVSESEDVIV